MEGRGDEGVGACGTPVEGGCVWECLDGSVSALGRPLQHQQDSGQLLLRPPGSDSFLLYKWPPLGPAWLACL